MAAPKPNAVRFPVDPRDVGPEKAARRMGLTLLQFERLKDELLGRGFPRPDPTTGMYDLKAIEAWQDARSGLTEPLNSAPPPRQDVWSEREAARLVKQAWRDGYYGLAALLAVAWDSQLSPVDVRRLQASQRRRDGLGTWFQTGRTKTGRFALATLSRRAETVLDGYLANVGAELVGPIFRNRSGAAYSKDTLGDDFRDVRERVFGSKEKRQLADFRRSGTVEAFAGDAQPEKVSAKMANTLAASNRLHQTYSPIQLASVRDADASRKVGRRRLREQTESKSLPPPARKSPAGGGGDS